MAYRIVFIGLSTQGARGIPLTDGYQAREWLPAYDEVLFGTVASAHDWIAIRHQGPTIAAVEELFRVENDASDAVNSVTTSVTEE